jgi:hypothetical protein
VQPLDLVRTRLVAQRIEGTKAAVASAVVEDLLAVQAQDVEPAVWSVAMRTTTPAETEVLDALDEGRLLRTHVLRPTWHLVGRDDLRWLLDLTAPRVHAVNGHLYNQLQLEPSVLARATETIVRALDGTTLTRKELGEALESARIRATGPRLAYIVMHAELEQVVVSGPRRGRLQTYARFDDRVPAGGSPRHRSELLEELTVRFFTGHGPATASDLRAWSSLTVTDVRAGLELAGDRLRTVEVDGRTFHLGADTAVAEPGPPSPTVHLLQGYDELLSGTLVSRELHDQAGYLGASDRPRFNAHVLLDGQLVGHWKRTLRTNSVSVEVALYRQLDTAERTALQAAADRYGAYLGTEARVVQVPLA